MSSKFNLILKLRELSVATSWKSGILYLLISLFVGLLEGFPVAMVVVVVDLMVELYTMMPHLGSFGSRIKYLLGPTRL